MILLRCEIEIKDIGIKQGFYLKLIKIKYVTKRFYFAEGIEIIASNIIFNAKIIRLFECKYALLFRSYRDPSLIFIKYKTKKKHFGFPKLIKIYGYNDGKFLIST